MSNPAADQGFLGPLPKIYQSHLVPLIFEPYAADLANRLAARPLSRVLEIAAGTGVVTRALASALPESVSIVATDLNQADARPGGRDRDEARRRVAPGRRHAAAVRRRSVRRGRLPVRRHVLPRQGQGVRGSAARAQAGRRLPVQRLGSDRGERIRRHRDDRAGIRCSPTIRRASWRARRTAITIARPSSGISPAAGSPRRPRIDTVAARSRAASPRDPGDRVLPGNAAAKRDRGARCLAARRSNRSGGGRHRAAVRAGEVDGKIQAHVVAIEK